MVTITDLTWDDDRLLELMWLMDARAQGELMVAASVKTCHNLAVRAATASGKSLIDTPETVALKALARCQPTLPCGWMSDTDFQDDVERAVIGQMGSQALQVVLTTADHDEKNAAMLAEFAEEHATYFGPNFDAPSFEEGYVDPASMKAFIEDWRESFMANLRRVTKRE